MATASQLRAGFERRVPRSFRLVNSGWSTDARWRGGTAGEDPASAARTCGRRVFASSSTIVRSWAWSRPPLLTSARCLYHGDPGGSVRLGSTRFGGNALGRSVAFLMPNCLSAVRVLLPARLDSVTEPSAIAGMAHPVCSLPSAWMASAGKRSGSAGDLGPDWLPPV